MRRIVFLTCIGSLALAQQRGGPQEVRKGGIGQREVEVRQRRMQ
jgi:hypothetical protein